MDPALLVGDVLAYEKTSSIKRNDVTIFWYPDDVRIMYVKRCIGLPGDSLQIEGSTVLVNGKPLTDIPLKFAHTVTTDGARINSRFLEKHQLSDNDYVQIAPDSYRFFLTGDQAINLSKLSLFKKIERSIAPEGETERMIYPSSSGHRWNADYYGPIYIPKKGDRIELTDENIDLYQKCIEFENESVRRVGTGLTINGQPRTTYEFKENYFFMMGDNRHNSLDSRYWGLLPHRLVVGKSMYIYWGHTRDRIGKEII
jgi:signal peptidase I